MCSASSWATSLSGWRDVHHRQHVRHRPGVRPAGHPRRAGPGQNRPARSERGDRDRRGLGRGTGSLVRTPGEVGDHALACVRVRNPVGPYPKPGLPPPVRCRAGHLRWRLVHPDPVGDAAAQADRQRAVGRLGAGRRHRHPGDPAAVHRGGRRPARPAPDHADRQPDRCGGGAGPAPGAVGGYGVAGGGGCRGICGGEGVLHAGRWGGPAEHGRAGGPGGGQRGRRLRVGHDARRRRLARWVAGGGCRPVHLLLGDRGVPDGGGGAGVADPPPDAGRARRRATGAPAGRGRRGDALHRAPAAGGRAGDGKIRGRPGQRRADHVPAAGHRRVPRRTDRYGFPVRGAGRRRAGRSAAAAPRAAAPVVASAGPRGVDGDLRAGVPVDGCRAVVRPSPGAGGAGAHGGRRQLGDVELRTAGRGAPMGCVAGSSPRT